MQFDYWGKTFSNGEWHHACHHCLDVAAVAQALLRANPRWRTVMALLSPATETQTENLLLFLIACHDLGKLLPAFQNLDPALGKRLGHPARGGPHHTVLGLNLWNIVRPGVDLELPEEDLLKPLLVATLCHHGTPEAFRELSRRDIPRSTTEDAREYLLEVAALFPLAPFGDDPDFTHLSWLAAGLTILADWIGSNEHWFGPDSQWRGTSAYWPKAQEKASRAVADLHLKEVPPSPNSAFHTLLPHLPQNATPGLMQTAVMNLPEPSGPELLILEDLTGGGKTEAAILAAHRLMRHGLASGIFVGLPTMATANAMYDRLSESYHALFDTPDASLVLAHGGTVLNNDFIASLTHDTACDNGRSDGRATCSAWLADNRKKSLLAPCGAGTIDQALLSVLGARHQSLRLLGLCRSVLVADEVHAYDEYTGTLLKNLLTFHAAMSGSAILLSATLPRSLRQGLVAAWTKGRELADAPCEPFTAKEEHFPLMTRVADGRTMEQPVDTNRALNVTVLPEHDESAMFETLCRAHRDGACACWVRNTVYDVLEAARVLTEEYGLPTEDVLIFHAAFTGCDRAAIERKVLARFGKQSCAKDRRKKILLASQVVEQSLDLDFDLLLSDLAPMELLIQRAGRCHRHERQRPPGYEQAVMHVLMPNPAPDVAGTWYADFFAKGQYVYPDPALLWRTARLLCDKGCLRLPEDARELVEGAYGNREIRTPQALEEQTKALAKQLSDRAAANFVKLQFDCGYLADSNPWGPEITAPTRLGEPSHGLRLIRMENGTARLWADTGSGPTMPTCLRSEIRVMQSRVTEAVPPPTSPRAFDDLVAAMPDKGKWCVCLPVRETAPGIWKGKAKNGRGQEVTVRYSETSGLQID
ncbi:CRISPR-associated helicase Cas3' [Pseudodesulfovibrio tunisiensis]|uniref:CRISPR-associated helicase Cas3' n=1 Tax=Pseudodesulfovibrio tunisiensis TaxID=463192 RepID=UPI001FB54169|nr:CRISPR-associated helicase Cas3' [Pseudodesulfovibrio tunisiensis]